MRQIQDLSDERQRGWCPHCGVAIGEHNWNRDHVPTRGLLSRPYPLNLPVVHICGQCNVGFSADEAYLIAFLGAVLSGSTNVDAAAYPSAAHLLRGKSGLRKRIAESGHTQLEYKQGWKPELDRIERVMVKNARGHWLYEVGEAVTDDPHTVWAQPLYLLPDTARSTFTPSGPDSVATLWPELGSRMMERLAESVTLQCGDSAADGDPTFRGGWLDVQANTYRYSCITEHHRRIVRMVLYEYLAAEVVWADEWP